MWMQRHRWCWSASRATGSQLLLQAASTEPGAFVLEANAVPFTNKTRLVTLPSVFVTVAATGMLPEAGYVEPDTGASVTVGEGGMVKVTGSDVLSTPLASWATTYAVCGPDA